MKHVLLSLMLLAACGKKDGADGAAAKGSLKDRALALAAKYGPKLGDLSKKLPDLTAKAKDLPVGVPGVDKLDKLLADNKSALEQAQDVLAKLPEKIGAESPAEAEKELAAAEKIVSDDIARAEKDEAEEEAIEVAAAAKK